MKQTFDSAKDVANATTDAISKTAGFFASTLIGLGKGVFHPIAKTLPRPKTPEPGAAPGIEQYLNEAHEVIPTRITSIDYGANFNETREFTNIDEALAAPRKEGQLVRWLNIDGLNPKIIAHTCQHFGIHTLSAEDALNTEQRPKIEIFDEYIQIIVRQIHLENQKLKNEQICFFLFKDTIVSFQEEPGDVFDPVRKRLEKPTSRFRSNQADYLFYTLLDSIVDHLFPLLEGYGLAMEDLEEQIMENPVPSCQKKLFAMKRDLSVQRRTLWPLREVIDSLLRDESGKISDELKTFFRDVQDHAVQVIDLLETYRDTASGLNDLYQSYMGNKMNEIMKVLTIMSSFFIPTTFVAGVYGMNFEYIPELSWPYAYFAFWGICLSMTLGLAIFFWRKGWIGGDH